MRTLWLLLLVSCTRTTEARTCGEGATPEARARHHLEHCGLDETIALASELVRFPTVSERETPADGPSFKAMGAHLTSWAKKHGLSYGVYGKNDVFEVHLGEGAPLIAFVMHGDVVPAEPSEWKTPPFEPKREGNRLYGRGSEDDKGPIAAVLVMMAALKKFEVPLPGRISAVIGNGEEHDWDGMIAYAKEKPHAKYVISLDASYPVVVAESGFVTWKLSVPKSVSAKKRGCAEVLSADVGRFLTVVPGEAKMTIAGLKKADVERALQRVQKESFTFEVKENGDRIDVVTKGEGIHSSEADKGRNALWALSRIAAELELCEGGAATMLKVVASKLDGDHWGEKLGLRYEHPLMGKLLVSPTMLRTEKDRAVLSVNMRRPAGKSSKEFALDLDRAAAALKRDVSGEIAELVDQRYVGEAALVDTSGPLVKTLLEIYRAETGDANARPISIRGGTYARLFPGAVSFGPALPGRPYRGHAPDEYVELDALALMMKSTLEAVLRLRASSS
jgi:predicted dipeptidase